MIRPNLPRCTRQWRRFYGTEFSVIWPDTAVRWLRSRSQFSLTHEICRASAH